MTYLVDRINNLLDENEELRQELEDAKTRKYTLYEVLYAYAEYFYVFTFGKFFNTVGYRNYLIACELIKAHDQKIANEKKL
jgi:hypothetical protein